MFKKYVRKVVFCFLVLGLILIGLVLSNDVNALEMPVLSQSEIEMVNEEVLILALEENILVYEYSYIVNDVYSGNEQKIGCIIDYNLKGKYAYAIVFKIDGNVKVIEVNFNGKSPYLGKKGTYIYPSLGYYIVKYNNIYYNILSDEKYDSLGLDENDIFYAAGNKDKDGTDYTITEPYIWGFKYSYDIPNFYYNYSTGLTNHSNNCANAAGLILLNYWNKFYNNDLLKETRLTNQNISGDARAYYMGIFYDYMNTNWIFGTGGTLPTDGYSGFERLISEKGYKTTRERNLNYSQIINKISNGIPVIITSTDYYYSNRTNTVNLPAVTYVDGDHTLVIDYERTWGIANAHTFIGYGYTYYSLYKDVVEKVWSPVWYNPFRYVDVVTRVNFKEELIKVANGWGGTCYFNYTKSNMYDNAAIGVNK